MQQKSIESAAPSLFWAAVGTQMDESARFKQRHTLYSRNQVNQQPKIFWAAQDKKMDEPHV
jgi:hypothetical protein